MKTIIPSFLLMLLFGISLKAQLASDSLELIKLYNSTNGTAWNNVWDLQAPVSEWYGVEISDNRVVVVNLGGNNLAGSIPDLKLDQLRNLALGHNQLVDTIPDFSGLHNLQSLFLTGNMLSGKIPNFSSLPLLKNLSCSNNQLSGSIPSFDHCPELGKVLISNNQISGPIPSLAHLEELFFLNINNNQISGEFPDLPTPLSVFNCHDNNLTGSLPDFQGQAKIKVFNCSRNQLTGEIPYYQNLLSFEFFRCQSNQLTGTIPAFEMLPKLSSFLCSDNQLTGEMPIFSDLPSLVYFYCDGNALTGTIPDYAYLSKLEYFHCHNNQLTGEIPDISQWSKLKTLLVQNNQLHGIIPQEAPEGFSQLRCFNNNLSGCYPDYVCQLWKFEAEDNPLLPWLGDHEPFCAGEDQIGAPCDDGKVETLNDAITEDCTCNDVLASSTALQLEHSITITPNPADHQLHIKVNLPNDFIVQLADTNGKILLQNINRKIIDISHLAAGSYFVSVILGNEKMIITEKIIIRRK